MQKPRISPFPILHITSLDRKIGLRLVSRPNSQSGSWLRTKASANVSYLSNYADPFFNGLALVTITRL
jgi:hypothetical protein